MALDGSALARAHDSKALASLDESSIPSASSTLASLVLLADAWMLITVLWAARFVTGGLDPAAALYALILYALVSGPYARRQRLTYSASDDIVSVVKNGFFAYALSAAVLTLTNVGQEKLLLGVAVASLPALLFGRAFAYSALNAARHRNPERTLVIGAGKTSARIIESLRSRRGYGLRVVGVVDDEPLLTATELDAPILGALEEVESIVRSHGIETILVSFARGREAARVHTLRQLRDLGPKVWIVPRLFDLPSGNAVDHIWGIPVIPLTAVTHRPGWVLKRVLDSSLAAVGLLLLSPLLLVTALAVMLESGRPVFIRQERVGRDGRIFGMYKFRSMRKADPSIEQTEWSAEEDRITKVGRFLREWGIDELPQLWNVVRGEMSLVGPRPERPYFVDKFSETYPDYQLRHRVQAGITGLAQVSGLRGDTPIDERCAFDNYYIERWSMSEDVKILMQTALSFRAGKGRDER